MHVPAWVFPASSFEEVFIKRHRKQSRNADWEDREASRSPSALNQQESDGQPRPPPRHLERIEEDVAPTGPRAEGRKWSLKSNDMNFLSGIRHKVRKSPRRDTERDWDGWDLGFFDFSAAVCVSSVDLLYIFGAHHLITPVNQTELWFLYRKSLTTLCESVLNKLKQLDDRPVHFCL